MTFKKISLESGIYSYEDAALLEEIVKKECMNSVGPMEDVEKIIKKKLSE